MTDTKTTLPARYYTDSAVFSRERERFHAEMWVAVAREEDIARPGDFVVREVAGESVIVTRDESGHLQAFYNVCRHRGTRICAEEKGTFAYQQGFVNFQLGVFATKPWLSGAIYWALNEFWVRPAWDGGDPRPNPPVFQKGLITYDGVRKPAWTDVQRWYKATPPLIP